MPKLLLATANQGKIREIRAIFAGLAVSVVGLDEQPHVVLPPEDGATFEENALGKARAGLQLTGLPTLADDSGLEVDALNGAPGVYSARYGGSGLSDRQRCDFLLEQLAEHGVTASPARFRCVVALVTADGREACRHGVWEGRVEGPPRGDHGFGYDPVFHVPPDDLTAAELPAEEKNRLSHRAQALQAIFDLLRAEPERLTG